MRAPRRSRINATFLSTLCSEVDPIELATEKLCLTEASFEGGESFTSGERGLFLVFSGNLHAYIELMRRPEAMAGR